MDRRNFLQIAAVTTLAAQGHLPLLAAERKGKNKKRADKKGVYTGPKNIYTEPAAIEPITGYLPQFNPLANGTMNKKFSAKYSLIACNGSAAKSKNSIMGSLDVTFSDDICRTTEVRKTKPQKIVKSQNIVKTELKYDGRFNTASSWTLDSSVEGIPDVHFVEKGTCDGKTMVVKSKSWTQKRSTSNPLIGRWALLPLLSSGKVKSKPLTFDMLDDSTLRPDQMLRYTGQIEIPVADGTAKLDSYAQTGRGIVPTHYLVDADGRVQLITMSTVNWALSDLG
jgi:hypothetical protein